MNFKIFLLQIRRHKKKPKPNFGNAPREDRR